MNKAPSLIAAIVLGLGISACGYFIGDGVKHLKTNNRYVNVRGLSEKEVLADTAELNIAITQKKAMFRQSFFLNWKTHRIKLLQSSKRWALVTKS